LREITLPYNFELRKYQLPIFEAFDKGFKRLILIHHRRAGKDKACWNLMIREAWQTVGNYYYLFPTYSQARKALWEGRDKSGMRNIDHIPRDLIEGKPNETEMKIKLKNGSLIQLIGVEDADKIVGTNPKGMVFSEYSLQNPKAWELMRPILLENGGWAIFNFTPRGKNHGFKLYNMALQNSNWFVSKLTIEDTNVLTVADMEEERKSGYSEDMIQQEYYCSFISAIQGSIYWEQVNLAEKNGHFTDVPYDPRLLVHTVWDLGKDDTNCIGFYQSNGLSIRKIDYLQGNKKGLPDWIKIVKEKPYNYGKHFAPHDIEVSDYSTAGNQSRKQIAEDLGIKFEVVPNLSIRDGIDAGRRFFSKLYVDKVKCADFIDAIPQYTREYDEENKIFKDTPLHDWTSHYADEHRYSALVQDLFDNETFGEAHLQVAENRRERNIPSDFGI
jgi:hypothetical protein